MTTNLQNEILIDPDSNARAEILLGVGCNCHRLQLCCEERTVEVIWSEPQFARTGSRSCYSGIPVLFPFPGRIPNAVTYWNGTRYVLPVGDSQGNALHGLVHDRAWRKVSREANVLRAQFQLSVDAAELREAWPSDFRIVAEYRLAAQRWEMTFTVTNVGQQALPCGFGLHPYFRVASGESDSGERCHVTLPVASEWELHNGIATGRLVRREDAAELQNGKNFSTLHLDALLSDLQWHDGMCRSVIADHQQGVRLEWQFWPPFREIVVYTPEHRQAICIEPWSCITDPLRLTERGIDTGLAVLAPQEELVYRAVMELHALDCLD